MKLSYRGIPYEQAPTSIETTEGEITGHYRGATTTFKARRETPLPDAIVSLKYRGAGYLGLR